MRLMCPINTNHGPAATHPVTVCCSCGKHLPLYGKGGAICDLDGPAFVAIFCEPCMGLEFRPDGPVGNPRTPYLREQQGLPS